MLGYWLGSVTINALSVTNPVPMCTRDTTEPPP